MTAAVIRASHKARSQESKEAAAMAPAGTATTGAPAADNQPPATETDPAVGKRSSKAGSVNRTHDLLANLDAAKKQKVQNEKLRNMVLDTEELALKVHQQNFASKPRQELGRLHSKAGELMKEYRRLLSYSHLKKFNVSRYMTDCAQEMHVRELLNPDDQPDAAPIEAVTQNVSKLMSANRSPADGLGPKDDPTCFDGVLKQGVEILGKVTTLLRESKLHGGKWAGLTTQVITLLKDVMGMGTVDDALLELNEQCRRIEFEIEQVAEEHQSALESGDMEQTESLYYKKITMQEALADLITKRFAVVDDVEEEVFKAPLRKVHEVHAAANAAIHEILKEQETLKSRCELDLASLTAEVERVNLEDYNETKASQLAVEKLNNSFKENLMQQQSCWDEIERLEKDLCRLGAERQEKAKLLIQTLEQEEKRQVEYQYFTQFTTQHRGLLELTMHNCELAEEITDSVDEFISAHCNAIEQRMRETERHLEDVRLDAHTSYLEHFRTMYLTIGDLKYKKEANVAALEEKIQVAHMQQEMHMESLNPKAREFSQLKKDLAKSKADLESQVDTLSKKSNLYIEAFKPTEQALIEAGRHFEHPVQTLNKMNESRKMKLIAYHQLVSGEDGGTELENERRVIEEMRQLQSSSSQTRRIKGAGSPKSPGTTLTTEMTPP